MRRIAIINQKGGVGKTTTAVNLGAALARLGRRVLVVDMDPQANASQNLGAELEPGEPSTYSLLTQAGSVADTVRGTSTPGLSVLPAHLDLSGAELELASAIGRESILKDALDDWENEELERSGRSPADIVLIDNPPSLGLLSVNGLTASSEVLIAVQTEFFALQGLSKLVEIVQLLRRRMKPDLEITGVLACMYDSRLRLAREVLGELRSHFPEQLFKRPIAQNVKLAETPSFSRTIFEYAPESKGAEDYLAVAREFLEREGAESEDESRSVEAPPGARPRGPHLDWLAAQTLIAAPADPRGLPADDVPGPSPAVAGAAPPSTAPPSTEVVGDEGPAAEPAATEPVPAAAPSLGAPTDEPPAAEAPAAEALTAETSTAENPASEEPTAPTVTSGVLVDSRGSLGDEAAPPDGCRPEPEPEPESRVRMSAEPGAEEEDPVVAEALAPRVAEDPDSGPPGEIEGTAQAAEGKPLTAANPDAGAPAQPPERPVYAKGSRAAERGLERAPWTSGSTEKSTEKSTWRSTAESTAASTEGFSEGSAVDPSGASPVEPATR